MANDIENVLTNILHKAAKKLNLRNYKLHLNLDPQRGDGFLGEFFKVSILDEESNTKIYLAVKKSPQNQHHREETSIEQVYKNEILFYSKIYPTLKSFEEEHRVNKPFSSLPTYITSSDTVGEEVIVFKDITLDGFKLRDKNLLLDDKHARLVFETYGHFHTISFCLKEQKPEEFKNVTKDIFNLFESFLEKEGFCSSLRGIAEDSFEALDTEDAEVRRNFKKYVDKTVELFSKSLQYEGEFSGILHGDCWSNNMMFKYDENSELEDINLLDFQVINVGTPVYDLSYFFYTGGCKELFDNLEYYLDIYHQSFSKWVKTLGSDPEKLLPRKALSEDWKKYSKFGMIMSLMLTKIKLISKEDSVQLIDASQSENKTETGRAFRNANINVDLFKKRIRDILVHMNEIGAL